MKSRIVLFLFFISLGAAAQEKQDSVDTADLQFYDELFSELDLFLDSLLKPRNFLVVNAGLSPVFLNSEKDGKLASKEYFHFSPSISFYSKSGIGLSGSLNILPSSASWNVYQGTTSVSYDYFKNRKFITGVSLTKVFTKENLEFYTSPLDYAATAYFTYRKAWLKPSIAFNYGWGEKDEVTTRTNYILLLRRFNSTTTTSKERVEDFNLTLSLRHDFYWLDAIGKNSFLRLTPQVTLLSGTQRYGFNQASNSYITMRWTNTNVLYNSDKASLEAQNDFRPLSITTMLKGEVSVGKFYLQPQLALDHYLPQKRSFLSYAVNTGFVF